MSSLSRLILPRPVISTLEVSTKTVVVLSDPCWSLKSTIPQRISVCPWPLESSNPSALSTLIPVSSAMTSLI